MSRAFQSRPEPLGEARSTPLSGPERDAEEPLGGRPPRPDRPGPASAYGDRLLAACGLPLRSEPTRPEPTPALDWATSGAMALTGPVDGPPRFATGPLATAARGVGLALDVLAPDRGFDRLDAPALLGERAALVGLRRAGRTSAGGSARLLACRDGTLALNLPRADDWALVPAWLEAGPRLAEAGSWNAIEAVLAGAPADALVERGRLMGLAVARLPASIDATRPWFRLHHETAGPATPGRDAPRVLDLSSLWAGPLATSLLAQAGASVLKVESPARPDGARSGPRAFFDRMNANKRACALDLRARRDRSRFEALLEAADVVVESARPRALEQLGYDVPAWVGARPGRLWVSITGYGRVGPEREWIAFGDDAACAAGLAVPRASSDPEESVTPCFCGDAIADPLTGLHVAAYTLALRRAGRGGLLDVALVDVAARAGGFDAGPLTLPIERVPDGWRLTTGAGPRSIAAPRARAGGARAPALTASFAGMLEAWGRAC